MPKISVISIFANDPAICGWAMNFAIREVSSPKFHRANHYLSPDIMSRLSLGDGI
jgi:hypothetical protein